MKIPIDVVIIDDEPDAISKLEIEFSRIEGINVVAGTTNPENASSIVNEKKPGIVFLDVQMPGKNGLEILKEIAALKIKCAVIMVTAYSDFMLDAFRNAAFDYLLKPVDSAELTKVIERYRNNLLKTIETGRIEALEKHLHQKIRIPSTYETWYFSPGEIWYFEADGKYTIVHLTSDKKITTSVNLGMVENMLPDGHFCRICKSYVINLDYLKKVDRKKKLCFMVTSDGREISLPWSKNYTCKLEHFE
jgi:two-component system, LytTR family, response regulator